MKKILLLLAIVSFGCSRNSQDLLSDSYISFTANGKATKYTNTFGTKQTFTHPAQYRIGAPTGTTANNGIVLSVNTDSLQTKTYQVPNWNTFEVEGITIDGKNYMPMPDNKMQIIISSYSGGKISGYFSGIYYYQNMSTGETVRSDNLVVSGEFKNIVITY